MGNFEKTNQNNANLAKLLICLDPNMLFFEKSESNRTKMLLVMHVRSIYRVAHRYLGFGRKMLFF